MEAVLCGRTVFTTLDGCPLLAYAILLTDHRKTGEPPGSLDFAGRLVRQHRSNRRTDRIWRAHQNLAKGPPATEEYAAAMQVLQKRFAGLAAAAWNGTLKPRVFAGLGFTAYLNT